ncbi:MAG: putative short-chain dehydrogenase [Roseibaca calidilacus]|uniref:Putative short-chain dehydrogenase n=1 Tax=Roseibaca calidilacus TaxID=1666912 RepID=A0A0P8AFE6_9RHOB|nr:SDR family NAD(P)-dependent oxidoreductase [Roseibaca calidilacus]KPP92976.1 MAG: putative short-chain dehydrogenase [Roseibaca calidilacus]CUX80355.1 hypothetical protein Ga0058931_1064 [Roseibaca calidilacus]
MKVLITGGASGFGAAVASACAARGDIVYVLDRVPGPGVFHAHDMASPDLAAWAALADWLAAQGPFDLVVLSAGISATGRFEDIPLQDHHKVTAVNLAGVIRLVQMLEKDALAPGARLVFIASLSCFTGYPGAASYAASKDGLAGFARSLRAPMRKRGVRVQLACPGPMDTPHATRYAPEGSSAKGRMSPERAAQAVLRSRSFVVVPGLGPKLAVLAGRVAPQSMTRLMGRVLFSKLK